MWPLCRFGRHSQTILNIQSANSQQQTMTWRGAVSVSQGQKYWFLKFLSCEFNFKFLWLLLFLDNVQNPHTLVHLFIHFDNWHLSGYKWDDDDVYCKLIMSQSLQECSWHQEMYGLGSHNNGEYLQHIMWVISLNLLGWGIILFCKCISQEYFQLLLTASEQPYTLRNCPQVTFEEWQNFLLGPNFLTHKTQHKVRMKQKYSMYGSWKLIIICGAWTTVLIMITCRTPVINYI